MSYSHSMHGGRLRGPLPLRTRHHTCSPPHWVVCLRQPLPSFPAFFPHHSLSPTNPPTRCHHPQTYCCEAYNILRKSANLLLNLFHLMAGASIPDIQSDPEKAMLKLQVGGSTPCAGAPGPIIACCLPQWSMRVHTHAWANVDG